MAMGQAQNLRLLRILRLLLVVTLVRHAVTIIDQRVLIVKSVVKRQCDCARDRH